MAKARIFLGFISAAAFLFGVSECAKILFVFPMPTKSHFTTNIALADALAERGHQVTVFSPYPREKAKYREITIDVKIFDNYFANVNITAFRAKGLLQFVTPFFFWRALGNILDRAMSTEEFKELVQSKDTFDLVIAEYSFAQESLAAFGHKFNAPIIDISSTAPNPVTLSNNGNPHTFSYIPDILLALDNKMSFFERVKNSAYGLTQLIGSSIYQFPSQQALMRKHFTYLGADTMPSLREMIRNTSAVLVNAHFSVNYPQPFAPNIIEIGGFHLKPAKKLPAELQKFMDEAKDGVVYISFGSVIRSHMLAVERIQAIVSTIKRLKQRVIMKWSDPVPFQGLNNVYVVDWAPQQEILVHPNLRLFVTHGGYNSLIEVTHAGVPIIGMPVFADQPRNIRFYESSGIGKGLEIDTFTSDDLYNTINTIINTPSFTANAKELSRRARDRPETAINRAVYWTEYVLRHKGAHHLKPSSVNLPYHQYILLDVIAFMFLALFIVYKLIRISIPFLCCSICRSSQTHSQTSKKKTN
uniref:UDP-gluconosyltransferase n=1 Tax=Trialeurodes vaporariorum TaxID=88556 RepID=A0A873P546_TRIVP|nr:UDP-gluconosyltransferase [Trialeurodes vaporariorum]